MLQSFEFSAPPVESADFDNLQPAGLTQAAPKTNDTTKNHTLRRIVTTAPKMLCFRSRDLAEHQKLRADLRDITPEGEA
jgi:hypothetical protein